MPVICTASYLRAAGGGALLRPALAAGRWDPAAGRVRRLRQLGGAKPNTTALPSKAWKAFAELTSNIILKPFRKR
jgi:hypothetical protein